MKENNDFIILFRKTSGFIRKFLFFCASYYIFFRKITDMTVNCLGALVKLLQQFPLTAVATIASLFYASREVNSR